MRPDYCDNCGGSGKDPNTDETCTTCGGSGWAPEEDSEDSEDDNQKH